MPVFLITGIAAKTAETSESAKASETAKTSKAAIPAAFALPKGTEEEKAARSKAIQAALRGCIDTPMEMMELAAETLELTESLLGRFNDSAASDLGVAALSLRSAIQGAWLNVRINISSIKDQDLAERSRERGEALLAKALPAADRIYAAVLDMM